MKIYKTYIAWTKYIHSSSQQSHLAQVAPKPTHNGVIALTLSALARNASASAAHCMALALQKEHQR